MARRSTARATELLFIAEHSISPDQLMNRFRFQPDGGTFHDGKTYFEWGNVNTLISSQFHGQAKVMSISDNPKYVYHLDRLAKSRREAIEIQHAIPCGAISGGLTNSKADVLVVDVAGRTFLVSFKEIEGQAKYVEERSQAAKLNLREFASKICSDRSSFLEFIGATLAGSSKGSSDFYIVLGDELIQLQSVLKKLASPRWNVQTADASTPKKHALLITVTDGESTYVLTRIEQSFEGARENVSQTKGIIFHFQQHPRSGMNYKRLLLDLR